MHKVTDKHLRRTAVVYLRQSTLAQVRHNTESQRLQYAMTQRAHDLGWKRVEVIDCDLGTSASAGSSARTGFEQLISKVAMAQVGIILSREVSRLSRTDKDWCRLLEFCRVFSTLIADDQQVYDVASMDDQQILGIKGTLSVVELDVIRQRMIQGKEAKASRGELRFRLPPGYDRDADGHPVKHPDARIREAVTLVFQRFSELRVGGQLFTWFHDEGIEMPVYQFENGKLRQKWRVPTRQYLTGIIKNPFYAGAYVYGRRERESVVVDGKLVTRMGKLRPPEECRVFIRDHHEGYITWEQYEDNVECLRQNRPRTRGGDTMTAPRGGAGLFAGLLRCGHCGRKLKVNYWGRQAKTPRYFCRGPEQESGIGCLSFAGGLMQQEVEQQVLAAVSPLGIEASILASQNLDDSSEGKLKMLKRRAEQLRYEARRASEQYNEADPKNRLVTAELERRWNEKLVAVEQAENELRNARQARTELDEETILKLERLGTQFEDAWYSPDCSVELKKKIVRMVINEMLVRRQGDHLVFVIHWAGGIHTEVRILQPAAGSAQKTPYSALEIIRELAPKYDAATIAGVLSRHGLRTGKGNSWNKARVAFSRRRYDIQPDFASAESRGLLTLAKAAEHCGISRYVVKRLLDAGLVRNQQTVPKAPLEIPIEDLESDPVRTVLKRFRNTGRLITKGVAGDVTSSQGTLFTENQEVENAR